MEKMIGECLEANALREMFKSFEHVKILGDFCIDKFARNPLTVYRYMHYRWAEELILSKKLLSKILKNGKTHLKEDSHVGITKL